MSFVFGVWKATLVFGRLVGRYINLCMNCNGKSRGNWVWYGVWFYRNFHGRIITHRISNKELVH